jgi:hypothetical protein
VVTETREEEKAFDPQAESRSVVIHPNTGDAQPTLNTSTFFLFVNGLAEEVVPWGQRYKTRDKQLRAYITKENLFASALGIVCSRNASFAWKLSGPPRVLRRYHRILESANWGKGWENLMVKTTIDLSTQDAGAFWEIVRQDNSDENSPVVGINHLDSQRCYHTNIPEAPVMYQDVRGNFHLLRYHNVITFSEMPAPIEEFDGLQYSTLTRLLTAFQTRKSMNTRDYEKANGRHAKAIHLLKGITTKQLQDAINTANASADASGLIRYMDPVVVGSVDPKADVGHDTIELTTPPEDYSAEEFFKHYMTSLAMAFMTDYQEFAPLPGGNLGTSTQSEVLHLKNRGKGPGLFRKLITHAINYRLLPDSIEFSFADPDFQAELAEAEVKKTRAQERQIRIQTLEITPQVARQLANDAGDLRQEYMAMMGDADQTDNLTVDDSSPANNQIDEQQQASQLPVQIPVPIVRAQTSQSQGFGERAKRIFEE